MFVISESFCIFDVHSRPTLENNILSSHFIEAPVGRCGFDLGAFFIIMTKKIDLTGRRFGKLKVIRVAENKGKNTAWQCICDCGTLRDYLTYNLLSNKSKSCGCVRAISMSKASITHGKSKTRLYKLYKGIKQRCLNKNNPAYHYYGGKGVIIYQRWLDDFMSFYNWSYDNGYKEGLSIDRIDPNGNYEPSNCRWVSVQKQQNNKLNSLFITINGEKLTLAEWAKVKGCHQQTMYSRFYRIFESLDVIGRNNIELIINFK